MSVPLLQLVVALAAITPFAVCHLPQQYTAGLFGCSAVPIAPNELLVPDF